MFAEIMKQNKDLLEKSDSYLCPQIDKMIDLLLRLESTVDKDFFDSIQHRKFAKGDLLLKEGGACHDIWFIESGFARQYMNNNGAEQIGGFYFAGEFIISNKGVAINTSSKINIQFMSNATVYVLHLNCLERLKIAYPLLIEIEKIGFECRTSWFERHNYLYHSTSCQRYLFIRNNHPVLLQIITLKHIASYLRITPETISRIRAKI